jgi:hypothetical protein
MRYHHTRLVRLEQRRRARMGTRSGHFIPVLRYPCDGFHGHWRKNAVCACGVRGCPQLQVGVALPEKALSAEAWAAAARRYAEERGDV